MHRNRPVEHLLVLHAWLRAVRQNGKLRLRTDKVDLCQELITCQHLLHFWPHRLRELHQDAVDFLPLLILQLTYLVVRLHHLGRLYEHRPSRVRLVMHNAPNLPLHCRSHRNDQTTIAKGGRHILVNQPIPLSRLEYVLQSPRHTASRCCQFPANLQQGGGCRVLHMSILVQNLVNAPHQHGISLHVSRQRIKIRMRRNRVLFVLATLQELDHIVDGSQ